LSVRALGFAVAILLLLVGLALVGCAQAPIAERELPAAEK
jgi:hypothetical protein